MAQILIVDDEKDIQAILAQGFRSMGHEARTAGSCAQALSLGREAGFDVVFLDVRLPDGVGLDILEQLRQGPGRPEIIIMTGFGDPDGAELAIKSGAWDYLEKPALLDEINLSLNRALRFRNRDRGAATPVLLDTSGVVGASPAITQALGLAAKAAPSPANVLITGATGTGKEVFARVIHRNSPQAGQPMVVVDCASLPENLVESTLFGHERGAFTGADKARPGLLRQAHGGVLFLDEVGELPLLMQKSLLRVLQERRFRPIGAVSEQASDFRLIAATNRDLDQMVREGGFREDLLFRLKTIVIDLPPLKDRRSDIKTLAIHLANRLCQRFGIEEKGFAQDFFQVLEAYDWPGNVRELANTMELVMAEALDEPMLYGAHLPPEIRAQGVRRRVGESAPDQGTPPPAPLRPGAPPPSFKEFRERGLERIEREYLRLLIQAAGGSNQEAQRISGLARTRLYTLLKKHGLSLKP